MCELDWAAGFWDGEGCASNHKQVVNGHFRLTLSVSQVEREPLERFAAAVGGGRIGGPYGPYKNNRQPHFRWVAVGIEATSIIPLLVSRVCGPKREQMLAALVAYESTAPDPTRCPRGHEFDEENTRIRPNGRRACRKCAAKLARDRYWKHRPESAVA